MKLKFLNVRTAVIAAAIGFVGLSGAVLSQTVPQVSILNPTDLIQVVPLGQPSAGNKYAVPPLVTNQFGYYKSGTANPSSGGTYTFGQNVTYAMFENAGTLAGFYTTLAASPSDGSLNCVFAVGAMTIFGVAANTGQSINNAITTLAANGSACYIYSKSNATWDRAR